jgi:hypothetical protein
MEQPFEWVTMQMIYLSGKAKAQKKKSEDSTRKK